MGSSRCLLAELVQRRSQPGGIQQLREARRVAVEVAPQQRPDAADRAVAFRLVEQLRDHGLELATVAEERTKRGTLIASGFIAGGALMGMVGAILNLDALGKPQG